MAEERLQNILSHAGIASRRHAAEIIESGRVTVDGIIVKEAGARFDPAAYITSANPAAVRVEHAVDVNTPGTYRVSYTLDSAAVYQTVVVR